MPSIHVAETSHLPADLILTAARDFSDRRAELWPDVRLEHLTVHEMGEGWADVTEGTPLPPLGLVWERLDYDWSEPGSVKTTVTDSNFFLPGSTWEIKAKETTDGTVVEVIAVRQLQGRGKLFTPLFRLGLAQRMVAQRLRRFLAKVDELHSIER